MTRLSSTSMLSLVWYLGLVALLQPGLPRSPATLAPPPSPSPAEVALAFLATSDAFYSGAIGYAGTPSPQAFAWNALLQLPHADALFQRLLETGNRAGQLYALAGLYYADSVAFRKAAGSLARATDSISVVEGCVVAKRPVGELVAEIRHGRWSAMLRTVRPYPAEVFN